MRRHRLSKKVKAERLSAYYRVPVCMIMRSNGVADPKDLHGKQIVVPERYYCLLQDGAVCDGDGCPEKAYGRYVVKKGDTIFDIAKRHHTTMSVIVRLNGIKDPETLKAGESLFVPDGNTGGTVHSVRAAETLKDLARIYGLDEEKIREYNFMSEKENVYPGMQLMIPEK